MSITVYVLDTFALMAFFNREAGHDTVRNILRDHLLGTASAIMSEINWGEFFYMTARKTSISKANQRLVHIERLGIEVKQVTRSLVKSAALFKIRYDKGKQQVSFADCFAAALAQASGALLVTGDLEFKPLESEIQIRWLPRI